MKSYANRILSLNLSSNSVETIPTEEYVGQFIGGRGIAAKLTYDLMPTGIDPLSPDNVLVIMTGPLTGTLAPSSGRVDVMSKSPASNLLGGANAGGFFGPELKYAGYDGIVISGKAASPVYIDIFNDKIELKDAGHLWGKGVFDTSRMLKKGDEDIQIACIGPSGENRVNLAGIAFSMRNYAARGGLGAVMGSKNLKAIAVRGTKGLDIARPDQLRNVAERMRERIKSMPSYREFPEWHYNLFLNLETDGKTVFGNYEDTAWEERFDAYENVKQFIKHAEFRLETCFGCPLRCWAHINAKGIGAASIIACQGTLPSLANFTKIKDFSKLWEAYLLGQDLGLDISSVSAIIAYAMDLYSKGILTKSDTDGLDLVYGNGDALIEMIRKMALRQGLGDVLSDGIKKASKKIGKGAEERAVYGKGGLELWLMEIRPFKAVALASAVTDSGSHNRATYGLCEFYYRSMKKQAETVAKNLVGTPEAALPTRYEHKPKLAIMYENLHTLADSLGVCSIPFMPVGLDLWTEAYNVSAGIEITSQALMTAAERVRTLERLFNLREGLTRKDDTLAERMFKEPLADGPWKGEVLDKEKFEEMKDTYYSLRGWDREGRPEPKTLKQMGLG
jgi:aldehyde:ferredoxin oxidoreductase